MNKTNVSEQVLNRLADELGQLTPEAHKAAVYVLENPSDVGVSTVREIAEAAKVKPNTFVRMARQIGFEGYEDFRRPFREAIRRGVASFPERARWLQDIRRSGGLGDLYANMINGALSNIEKTFADIDAEELKEAAHLIWSSRRVFVLGVGINSSNAANFTYLAGTGMTDFQAIPGPGATPIDDLAWCDGKDTLIAITCKPYRTEVVNAVHFARKRGARVIGLSDSAASPVVVGSDFGFVVATETPQFFPSSVAIIGLLEVLLSFVIAIADPKIVDRVGVLHKQRRDQGLYWESGT